ncbi:MAG: PrsW family intramembrane metalloprotease [Ignavibacteriae bacterium]|nr:PrsW family intramembrane metalloprotease [Ignavibacteriota bacterium]
MPITTSILAALIPMFLYLILLWQLDKNERESFSKIFKHFLWGAFGAIFLGIIFSLSIESIIKIFVRKENQMQFIGTVLIAPFVEEITKGIFLLRSINGKHFDNITDGLVYGGAIGLGFGMTENIMYFVNYDETFIQWASLVFTRTFFSAVMHAIATATFGAFLAKTKFSISNFRFLFPFIGISLAMFFHFMWNFSLMFEFTFGVGILFMFFLVISFLTIFKLSIKSEQKIIEYELLEESDFLGLPELKKLSFSKNENKIFPENKKNKSLLNFATKLAFRKFQMKNTNKNLKEIYNLDIELYRKKILNLFNQENSEKI